MPLNKKFSLLICIAFTVLSSSSQSFPPGISYQAIVRDINGDELSNSSVAIEFSIRKNTFDGPVIFDESHNIIQTNQFGLFSTTIGNGVNTGMGFYDALDEIDWGEDDYFIEVRAVIPGQGAAQVLGVSQLLAVPYSLYALKADSVDHEADGDPTNELISSVVASSESSLTFTEGEIETTYDVSDISYATWSKAPGLLYSNEDKVGIGTATPNSTASLNGSISTKVIKLNGALHDMTASTPASQDVHVFLCDVSLANVTVKLISATQCEGRIYKFRKHFSGGNTINQVNIVALEGELIEGVDTYSMNHNLAEYATIISDGTGWFLIDHSKE